MTGVIKKMFVLMLVWLTFINYTAEAQYKRIVAQSGTQSFPDNVVAVSYIGTPPSYLGQYFCGYGPYHIGYFSASWFPIYTPISYTFQFTNPVQKIMFEGKEIRATDSFSAEINGAPYQITSADIRTSPNNCGITSAGIAANGKLTSSLPQPQQTVGRVEIKNANGITSFTLAYTAQVLSGGGTGGMFSVSFGQVYAGNSGPACPGSTVQLHGDSSITEPGSFYWSGPNGYTSMQQHPVIENLSKDDTGVYTFMYISGADTLTDTTHVKLLPGPDKPVVVANANPICKGATLQLTATSSPGATYQWVGPNKIEANNPTLTVSNVQEYHEADYTVTVTQYTCSLSATMRVVVNHPVSNTVAHAICMNDSYDFNGTQLTEAGTYIDTLTGINGCDSIVRLELAILPDPQVAIIVQRDIVANPCLGDVISLAAEGASNYNWYHNEQHVGSTDAIQVTLTESANRFILTGTDANACKDTVYASMPADGCCMVSLPDAFTPNGDSKNDRFGAIPAANTRVNNYRLEVFNRLGQQVYISNSLTDKWDGTNNGLPAGMGVYFYILSYECYDGGNIKKKGDVTLLR